MKNLLILGVGSAGTMAANKLYKKINRNQWVITVVDFMSAKRVQLPTLPSTTLQIISSNIFMFGL